MAKRSGAEVDPKVRPLMELAAEINKIKQSAQLRRREDLLEELRALKENTERPGRS